MTCDTILDCRWVAHYFGVAFIAFCVRDMKSTIVILALTTASLIAGERPRIAFPASRVSIIPAPGYYLVMGTQAVQQSGSGWWLSIDESSHSVDSTLKEWSNPANIASRGLTPVARGPGMAIDGMQSTKLAFSWTEGVIVRSSFTKLLFTVGDSLNSLTVSIWYPDTLRESLRNELFGMIPTIRWDRSKTLDPMDLLSFTIEPRGPFAVYSREDGFVEFTPGGRSFDSSASTVVYSVHLVPESQVGITEEVLKNELDRILAGLQYVVHISSVVELNRITLDGIRGYESISMATNGEKALTLYAAILFHPVSHIALFGLTEKDSADVYMEYFKEMSRTFKRKRIESVAATECGKLIATGQFEQAKKCFDAVLSNEPASLSALLGSADALRLMGRNGEAVQTYGRIIDADHSVEEAFAGRGKAHYALKEDLEAINDYNAAIDLNEDDVDVLMNRALAKSRYGNLPGAEKDFLRAIRQYPDSALLHRYLGDVRSQFGPRDSAIASYSQAIRLNSLDAASYASRGKVLKEKGDFRAALKDLAQSLMIEPSQSDLFVQKGEIETALGLPEEAYRDFDYNAKRAPRSKGAIRGRGIASSILGNQEEGMRDFDAAIQIDKSDGEAYLDRGIVSLKKGDFKSAAVDLRSAVQRASTPLGRMLLYGAELRVYGEGAAKANLRKFRTSTQWISPHERFSIDFLLGTLTEKQLLDSMTMVDSRNYDLMNPRCTTYFTLALLEHVSGMKTMARKHFDQCIDAEDFNSPYHCVARMLR
jgi:tetratricopeptide (TPR) repeat protein